MRKCKVCGARECDFEIVGADIWCHSCISRYNKRWCLKCRKIRRRWKHLPQPEMKFHCSNACAKKGR